MKPPLVVRVAGVQDLGLTLTPEAAGELLGLSDDAVRVQCRDGVLPTMPRHGAYSSWRIPTCRLLEQLGIPYEVVPDTSAVVNGELVRRHR
jgi:hypothetical protein